MTRLVTPVKAGAQGTRQKLWILDSRFRGNDGLRWPNKENAMDEPITLEIFTDYV